MIAICFYSSSVSGYEVNFEGLSDLNLINLIQSVSQLEKLKESPPATLLGLKRRAEDDIKNIQQAVQSQGYFNAKISFFIDKEREHVSVRIDLGPVYPLDAFNIQFLQNGEEFSETQLQSPICLQDLKIILGEAALPEKILSAEETLLDQLNLQGYAFASIKKREVIADQKSKSISVFLVVDVGPLTYFGNVSFKGLERVKENFFHRKLRWSQGEIYDPNKIEKTQEALELSGLFKSVTISHADKPEEGNFLPLEISVLEGKQRSIGFGLNYNTSLGPGASTEWEDRNIFGEGQKLSVRADVWKRLQNGRISYLLPDFGRTDQNLIWLLECQHERIKSFVENTFAFSGTIERKVNEYLRFSYGGMYKRLQSQKSDFNGIFNLLKIPLQFRWSDVDNILDPTKGSILLLKITPSFQIFKPRFAYCINTLTASSYLSLTENKRHILATKLIFGTIFGTSKHEIPPPERFLAGSESTLRGYRYLTVSPLKCHKPLGGRSMLIYSIELRNRIGKDFGLVFFYDIGNVYENFFPDFRKGLLQSAGLGIRYYTPIGPLRLDIAFPINRRRHIDHSVEIYFSIGQAF